MVENPHFHSSVLYFKISFLWHSVCVSRRHSHPIVNLAFDAYYSVIFFFRPLSSLLEHGSVIITLATGSSFGRRWQTMQKVLLKSGNTPWVSHSWSLFLNWRCSLQGEPKILSKNLNEQEDETGWWGIHPAAALASTQAFCSFWFLFIE